MNFEFSVLAKQKGDTWIDVTMPDENDVQIKNHVIEACKNDADNYLVSWPVNPHFTGREAILTILNSCLPKRIKTIGGQAL